VFRVFAISIFLGTSEGCRFQLLCLADPHGDLQGKKSGDESWSEPMPGWVSSADYWFAMNICSPPITHTSISRASVASTLSIGNQKIDTFSEICA
jgi:hypothetical protein